MVAIPSFVADLSLLKEDEKEELEELRKAMESDEFKTVEDKLVNKDYLLEQPIKEGEGYPLHFAARYNCYNIVGLLVSRYPKAVIETNRNEETPIFIAIKHKKFESVKQMSPYFRNQINNDEQRVLPGQSLVHAVLEHCADDWTDYFKVLFGDYHDDPEHLELHQKGNNRLKTMLMNSYRNEGKESPLSWFIRCENDKAKNKTLAIEIAKTYPKLMEVPEPNGDKPIHQAFNDAIHGITGMDFVKEALQLNQKFHLEEDGEKHNILHLLASNVDYCTSDKDGIFKILENVDNIYNHVRQKHGNGFSPLELAAQSRNEIEPKTNDNFIKFSINVPQPTTEGAE